MKLLWSNLNVGAELLTFLQSLPNRWCWWFLRSNQRRFKDIQIKDGEVDSSIQPSWNCHWKWHQACRDFSWSENWNLFSFLWTANVYSHSTYVQVCSQLFWIIKIVAIGAVVVVVSVIVNLPSLSSLLSLSFLSTSCQLCQIGSRCPSPFQFLKMSITAPHKYLSD